MKYTVRPMTNSDCDCEDCRAGKHLYSLHRCQDGEWKSIGFSLQSYASADACQRDHYWGIAFHPDDVWEDGTPILEPESAGQNDEEKPTSDTGNRVPLNVEALRKSAEALERHWLK